MNSYQNYNRLKSNRYLYFSLDKSNTVHKSPQILDPAAILIFGWQFYTGHTHITGHRTIGECKV